MDAERCYNRLGMDFRILGPLEVRDRGRPLELRRPKQRALLAILLLRAGETASSDELIDLLWGESPPRTARAALQNYVAQLRRSLGPGIVQSRAGGYVLDASPEQVDLGRFERLTAEGRAAVGEERVEKLRDALAMWRGAPLADLAFEPFAAYEANRLEELRTAALEDLIDAELSLGSGGGLVEELEALIVQHPFRERLRGQLMLALYRAGRQAEALAAYQETRRTLVAELGIEPSAPLRELEQAILRQDASLAAPARAKTTPPAPPEERRKTVTVLVAEVGYPESLDIELRRETSTRALSGLRAVLSAHGATIEQRSGDEVMAVFGVPRSHEDDALRAARAALELQAELATVARLRIGVETGEVLTGADDAGHGFIAGPVIALTKRILEAARPGEILAGPSVRRLLGQAAVVETPDDGLADSFRIVGVVEGVPVPARHLEAPLVGRGAELASLRAALDTTVRERDCRLLLILGEPGIGKTRLASELAAELNGATTVLVGRCVSYGRGATYLPLAEIIGQVLAQRDGELAALLAADDHAELIAARLVGLTGEEDAPASGGETFWAVRRLFETLALEQPVVVVFEDLHWAEPTLLDLIEYLAERADAPLLLLGLARPELLDERPQWLESEPMRLAPLSGEASEALIDNLREVPHELRTRIIGAAGGNPLFLEQLLAHAAEDGDPDTVPPSLEVLLASRLDRLEAGELAVLQRAAVAGRELDREAVVHLMRAKEPAGIDAHLRALVRKGLLREPSGEHALTFHHVLVRDAAYATLPKRQRADLHERFAGWLEAGSSSRDEVIGFHLEQAYRYRTELRPIDEEARRLAADAGDRLALAGLRAARTGDTKAASSLLARSSSLLDAREVARRDLLTELGLAVWRSGDLDRVEQVFTEALEIALSENDRRAELRARLELANLRLARAPEGGADELLSFAAEAIPVLEERGDDRALGRMWYVSSFVRGGHQCRYRESTVAAERALGYFRRSGWSIAPCLQELSAGLYYGPTAVADALHRCRSLLAAADRGGEANIVAFLAGLEAMAGRLDPARELASRALAIYEELGWADKISTNYATVAGDIELMAGNYAHAERLLSESCRRLEAWGEQGHLATQAAQLGEAVYSQGRFEESLRWAEVAERCAASDDAGAQFSWRALRAKVLARQAAMRQAKALARKAVELAAETDAVSQHAQVLLAYAEVLRLDGRVPQAKKAIVEALELLDGKGNLAAGGTARSRLAELQGA